jgi:hypothetical protein
MFYSCKNLVPNVCTTLVASSYVMKKILKKTNGMKPLNEPCLASRLSRQIVLSLDITSADLNVFYFAQCSPKIVWPDRRPQFGLRCRSYRRRALRWFLG